MFYVSCFTVCGCVTACIFLPNTCAAIYIYIYINGRSYILTTTVENIETRGINAAGRDKL